MELHMFEGIVMKGKPGTARNKSDIELRDEASGRPVFTVQWQSVQRGITTSTFSAESPEAALVIGALDHQVPQPK